MNAGRDVERLISDWLVEESPRHAPFCSPGCKDRDLLKWLGDGYRIPGPPADPEKVDSSESGD